MKLQFYLNKTTFNLLVEKGNTEIIKLLLEDYYIDVNTCNID